MGAVHTVAGLLTLLLLLLACHILPACLAGVPACRVC